jgi:hypothetical protein
METQPINKTIAVVGSRKFAYPDCVRAYVLRLDRDWTVISGGCPDSPDEIAQQVREEQGYSFRDYPADWNGPLGRGAGLARNSEIVRDCRWLVSFWDGNSPGSADTLIKAFDAGKLLQIWTPRGEVYWRPGDLARLVERAKAIREGKRQ